MLTSFRKLPLGQIGTGGSLCARDPAKGSAISIHNPHRGSVGQGGLSLLYN